MMYEATKRSLIYFDNAATSYPKPRQTRMALDRALRLCVGNPGRGGHSAAMASAELLYSTREQIAGFFGGDPEGVVFTQNTTYALNLAMKGVLKQGDRILISDLEHNALYRPAKALERYGIGVDQFAVDENPHLTLANARAALRENTRMLACLWQSNLCPWILPVEELGRLCYKNGLYFLVDAAQAAGHFPIDVRRCHIDALCAPGHKGLYGIMGCGFALLSQRYREFAAEMPTLIEGGSGLFSTEVEMPPQFPERFEGGTLPLPAIAALSGGLRFLSQCGQSVIENEHRIYSQVRQVLKQTPGVTLYGPDAVAGNCLLFRIEGRDCAEVAAAFSEKGICLRDGLHCAPLAHRKLGSRGALRASFGAFNRSWEVDRFADTLSAITRGRL